MTWLDWTLAVCAVLGGGTAGYMLRNTLRLVRDLDAVTDQRDGNGYAWLASQADHRQLDDRITRAHTVATALGQTDIVTILEGNDQ